MIDFLQAYAADTVREAGVDIMLVQRHRQWANINQTLVQCIVLSIFLIYELTA